MRLALRTGATGQTELRVYGVLRSTWKALREAVLSQCSRTMVSAPPSGYIPKCNVRRVGPLPVPLPSVKEQRGYGGCIEQEASGRPAVRAGGRNCDGTASCGSEQEARGGGYRPTARPRDVQAHQHPDKEVHHYDWRLCVCRTAPAALRHQDSQ